MAEFLAESKQIQQLDLRQNEVKIGGLMALCLALRINRSLVNMYLDYITPQEQVSSKFHAKVPTHLSLPPSCLVSLSLNGSRASCRPFYS